MPPGYRFSSLMPLYTHGLPFAPLITLSSKNDSIFASHKNKSCHASVEPGPLGSALTIMASKLRSRFAVLAKRKTWELEPEPSTFAPNSAYSNKDMDPVPPHLRTWTTLNYIMYWISDATNVAVWELASSMLAIGLSWCVTFPVYVRFRDRLTFRKEASSSCDCGWSCHNSHGHGCERNHRRAVARSFPSSQPIFLWLLV